MDKPAGMTSHDVVSIVRRVTGERSVGHLGTLDPMATGVLPLVLGKFTRLAQFYGAADKEYRGVICFGYATDTYDAEGEPTDFERVEAVVGADAGRLAGDIGGGQAGTKTVVGARADELDLDTVRAAAMEFVGRIQQIPPPFSAKKVNGVPAYKLARREVPVNLKPVDVRVGSFVISGVRTELNAVHLVTTSDNEYYGKSGIDGLNTVLEAGGTSAVEAHESPRALMYAEFSAVVSAGTYVRSLAHDLGRRLGVGAHLARLRRIRHGGFHESQAVGLEALKEHGAGNYLLAERELLPELPAVVAAPDQVSRVRHGNAVNLAEFSGAARVRVFDGPEMIAIAQRVAGTLFQPKVVLI